MNGADGPEQRFEDRWRKWATRPPKLTPEAAARAVAAAIREDRRPRAWPLAAVAASIVAVVLAGGLWLQRPPPAPTMAAATADRDPIADGVVLMWLDPETPLYMTFQVPESEPEMGDATP